MWAKNIKVFCFFFSKKKFFLLPFFFTAAHAQTLISADPPKIVLRSDAFGLPFFPDGSMFSAVIGGRTLYFAADGGRAASANQGTIVLSGDLDHLQPIMREDGQVVASLRPPAEPGASGFDAVFDRDYAGGGPVLWDQASGLLLHAYHGEYHFVQGDWTQFYSAIGMAVSRDEGRSFTRLGLAIRPALPPEAQLRMPSSAGTLVPVGDMLYLYYDDLSADRRCDGVAQGGLPCLAVAAAPRAEVLAAASRGTLPVWHKYFRGKFSEAGIGGNFSPLVVTDPGHWIRWPTVMRDPASGWFFLAYEAGAKALELRMSRDGLAWGNALTVMPTPPDTVVNYASLLQLVPEAQPGRGSPRFALTIAFVAIAKSGERIDFRNRNLETISITVEAPG